MHQPETGEDTSGQRRCARSEWCKDYELSDDGQRLGALGPRAFCDADRKDISDALDDLPAYYIWLWAELGSPAVDGLRMHMPFGPRLPLRADIDALMRLTAETLCSWEERVRDVARLTILDSQLSRQRREGKAVVQAARTLGAHLDVLLALAAVPMTRMLTSAQAEDWLTDPRADVCTTGNAPSLLPLDGADAGLEILDLKRRARSVLGETKAPPIPLVGVVCRRKACDLRALYRADPPQHEKAKEHWSVCAGCGDLMTETEYRQWVRRCASYERGVRTVPVLENLPGHA
jgi:hypothetical protein